MCSFRFLQPLQQLASGRLDTHLAAFEIYYRKRRPLLMLRALKKAKAAVAAKASEERPKSLDSCQERFDKFVAENSATMAAPVLQVIALEQRPQQ